MEATKTRKAPIEAKAAAEFKTDLWNKVRAPDSASGGIDGLAIEDDFHGDTDPYNSTGSHVILELKKYARDE